MSRPAPLVLASASPRRSEILGGLGLVHEVHPASVDEAPFDGEPAEVYVDRLANEKAAAVARERPDAWVLAGDTVVAIGRELLGKPRDADEAVRMLTSLEGRTHRVVSGLALARPADGSDGRGAAPTGRAIASGSTATDVTFRSFGSDLARAYVATGEPMDKAGAYGIQGRGAALVEEVRGDYFAVVGLPVSLLVRLLESEGRPYRFAME